MPPAKRARTGRGRGATSSPTGRGRAHGKSESSERDTHDASSSQQAGGDDEEDEKAERNNAADARRERQLQINRQAQHRHREKRKAREVEFEGRIKQLTEQLAQMSCLKDENDFLKGHLQLEQRQVAVLKHELEFKNQQIATLKTAAAQPQAPAAAQGVKEESGPARLRRKLSKTISEATPDEWLQLVQAAQEADPEYRVETMAAYQQLCSHIATALQEHQRTQSNVNAALPPGALATLLAESRSLINKMSMLKGPDDSGGAQAKAQDDERWVRSMVSMRLSDEQTQRLLVLREHTVDELSNLYKFRQVLARHAMQLSESLVEFVKSVNCAGIMPEVWQSHGMMSSLLEDLGANRTDEETVFKNFHIDAWAVLTQVQRAIFIVESAPAYPDILAMLNSMALLASEKQAENAPSGPNKDMQEQTANTST